jgi:hypothetical protein
MSGPSSIGFSTSLSETGRPMAGASKGPGMSIAWRPPAHSLPGEEPCAFAEAHSAKPVDPLIAVADWLRFLQKAEDGAHASTIRSVAIVHVDLAIKALGYIIDVDIKSGDPVPSPGACGC